MGLNIGWTYKTNFHLSQKQKNFLSIQKKIQSTVKKENNEKDQFNCA